MAEILDHLPSSETPVEGGAAGEKTDAATNFLGILANVVAGDGRISMGGLEQGAQHAQSGGLSGAVGAEKAENLARVAGEAQIVDRTDESTFSVAKGFSEIFGDYHGFLLISESDKGLIGEKIERI